jgi:Tol biopolymer transport system component
VRRPSNARGQEEVLLKLERGNWANDWSRDGRVIVYTSDSVATGAYLWTLSLTGDRTPAAFHQTGSNEQGGAFSSDGRWIAYQSNAAGQAEVFVRPFPPASEQHHVSRGAVVILPAPGSDA